MKNVKMKKFIKSVIRTVKKKELVPVPNNVSDNELLKGRTALIIGGTGGIGIAIAKSFIESGCNAIICGTNEAKLTKYKEDFSKESRAQFMQFDVMQLSSFESKLEAAEKIYGKIDILVISSGVHTNDVDFFAITPQEYDRVMNVNLKGIYFLSQAYAKYMIRNHISGNILFVSSSRGSEPAWSPYGISKWSLNGMTKGLAKILIPHGITVNAIAPGVTATELIGIKESDSIFTTENSVNRLVLPVEVANVAKLLVSASGKMLVGEVIHLSGGRGVFDVR